MQNATGQTPLMIAASSGNDYAIELLLREKAQVSLKNNQNCTALDIAQNICLAYERRKIVQLQSSLPSAPTTNPGIDPHQRCLTLLQAAEFYGEDDDDSSYVDG